MKRFYNQKKRNPTDYKEGEMVWLDAQNLKTFCPNKKLDQKKLGPFKILEKISQGAYQLLLPKSWNRIHPVFNEALLFPYHSPRYPNQSVPKPPGPVNQEGHPEYEVEEILASRKRG